MNKTILALALMVTLASCGASTVAPAPVADSTAVVAVDTAGKCVVDSTCVDSVSTK